MNVRAIALTIPLALGIACTHTGQTGAASRPSSSEGQQASGGAAGGAPLAQDPIMRPGPSIQGHGDDQIVVGEIADATGSSLTIQTPQGEKRTLQIVPETMIELDGQDASSDDLTEGQPVRASYEVVEGQEVAVKIRAGDASAGASDAASPGSPSTGQDLGTGSSSGATGPAPTPDPQSAPDAGWGPPPGHGVGEGAAGRPQ
jgi:hypothetical protein